MIDYHVHTRLCNHATGTMEQLVRAAIDKGRSTICFLDGEDGVSPCSVWGRGERAAGQIYARCLSVLESMLDYDYFNMVCHLDHPKKFNHRPSPATVDGCRTFWKRLAAKIWPSN